MNIHFVGRCTRDQADMLDTKALSIELAALDPLSATLFVQENERGSIFIESSICPQKCISAIKAQAARLGISL